MSHRAGQPRRPRHTWRVTPPRRRGRLGCRFALTAAALVAALLTIAALP